MHTFWCAWVPMGTLLSSLYKINVSWSWIWFSLLIPTLSPQAIATPAFPQGITWYLQIHALLLLEFQHLSNQTHIFSPPPVLEPPFIHLSMKPRSHPTLPLPHPLTTSNRSLSLSLPTKYFLNWFPFLHFTYLSVKWYPPLYQDHCQNLLPLLPALAWLLQPPFPLLLEWSF